MKTFHFGQLWQVYGTNSMEVPIDCTLETAMDYVRENWGKVSLPSGEYVQDSDEPDFEACYFEKEA